MDKTVQKRFFEDPEWYQVEDMIMKFINPLLDMKSIDRTQSAEAIKAEMIGRIMAHDQLLEFIQQSKLVGKPKTLKTSFK